MALRECVELALWILHLRLIMGIKDEVLLRRVFRLSASTYPGYQTPSAS